MKSIMEYWLKEAENNNKNNASIFLIGNKADESSARNDIDMQPLLSRHNISKCFEVSAKTGENIETSFV